MTTSPALTWPTLITEPQPVVTPQVTSETHSSGMSGSTFASERSSATIHCEKVPVEATPPISIPSILNRNPPFASTPVARLAPRSHRLLWPVMHQRHLPHVGIQETPTWSPTATPVTPGPTASTTPAPSWPPTMGRLVPPHLLFSSEWHTPP